MSELGRILIALGLLLILIGFIFLIFSRFGVPFGRLPGDLSWRGRNWSVSIPIASSIILSVVLSLIFWAIGRFHR